MKITETNASTVIEICTSYAIFLKTIPNNFYDYYIHWDNLVIDTNNQIVHYDHKKEAFTREETLMILGIATSYGYKVGVM